MKIPLTISTAAGALAVATCAVAVGVPAGTSEAYYNTGVKWVDFVGVEDSCEPDQALPCTLGAGTGDANVLIVTQGKVGGYHQFNAFSSTADDSDKIWVAGEVSGQCRALHDVVGASVDPNLADVNEGVIQESEMFQSAAWPWIPGHDGTTLSPTRVAANVPISTAFDNDLIFQYPDAESVFARGEAEIQQRMADGMSAAEARAIPFEVTTGITLVATLVCDLPGAAEPRFKDEDAFIPLTIRYEPAVVGPAGGAQVHGDEAAVSEITDVDLQVTTGDDPCTLALSGTVSSTGPTSIQYRFRNPYGQPSNTYEASIGVGGSVAFQRTVDVPYAEVDDNEGDLATLGGSSDLDGLAADVQIGAYTGTYMLEVLSPNAMSDGDGFSVPFCTGTPTQVGGTRTDQIVSSIDPTHRTR